MLRRSILMYKYKIYILFYFSDLVIVLQLIDICIQYHTKLQNCHKTIHFTDTIPEIQMVLKIGLTFLIHNLCLDFGVKYDLGKFFSQFP